MVVVVFCDPLTRTAGFGEELRWLEVFNAVRPLVITPDSGFVSLEDFFSCDILRSSLLGGSGLEGRVPVALGGGSSAFIRFAGLASSSRGGTRFFTSGDGLRRRIASDLGFVVPFLKSPGLSISFATISGTFLGGGGGGGFGLGATPLLGWGGRGLVGESPSDCFPRFL